jgi:hypothetical protein
MMTKNRRAEMMMKVVDSERLRHGSDNELAMGEAGRQA